MVEKMIEIQGVNILPGNFRNFAGKAGTYTKEGDRYFNISLDRFNKARYGKNTLGWSELNIDELIADGWNVRFLKAREEGEPDTPILKLNLKYRDRSNNLLKFPPRVFLITRVGGEIKKVEMDEESVGQLDYAEIANANITITPYNWDVGKVSAYVRNLEIELNDSGYNW